MLILLFAVELGWLPSAGYGGPRYVILPAITISVSIQARVAQVLRSAMLDELGKAYVTAARARGLREARVVYYHALKNAAIPTITLIGAETATLLNGAIVVETLFSWPGIGSLLIQAIERRDLPLVEASIVIIALMVIGINLIVDMMYSVFNPRIRY
jgi:ABC-type dipeptide/oligopeptide/nickel transport system permease component